VFKISDQAMKLACSRLSDAQVRTRPYDRIIDAVIGLEALLLAPHDVRGELSFRFSLNYSMLFDKPADRHRAFRTARKLYELRSDVAHGSVLKEIYTVGDDKLTQQDAAKCACEALRRVIKFFLPTLPDRPYAKSQFWETKYFDLQFTD
jgi:hypothetical protein